MSNKIKTYVIDLFCGAGGTSTAIHKSNTNIEVVACINHDKNAILSHKKNYPNCLHFTEDIRTANLTELIILVKNLRKNDPSCKIAIWASLECTNFSRAKCGPKDADSRTLAEDMFRYLLAIDPDFFWVENVEEFRSWGPLDINGNPDKNKLGESYSKWVKRLTTYFFNKKYYEEVLMSSDFGGRTIRKRLFLQFSKDPKEIGIPIQTHSKNGSIGKEWLPVRDILDLKNYGSSIFTRKKPLVPNTHRNIYKGLIKFTPKEGMDFGYTYYGNSGFVGINDPSPTLTTKDRVSMVSVYPVCITNPQYGGSSRSINEPAATVIARQDKAPLGIASTGKHDFKSVIVYGSDDKKQHIEWNGKYLIYNIFPSDDEWLEKIKIYMYQNNLIDVCVRPLTVMEMLRIQGFPADYCLEGTQTEQKKYIGNSVEVFVGIALFESIDKAIKLNN